MSVECDTPNFPAGALPLFMLFIPRNGNEWLTSNSVHRMHHHKVGRIRRAWAESTMAAAAQARVPKSLPAAELFSEFCFEISRTRDPLNFADTLKPIVDFLVKQWNCWPDDNPIYLTQHAPFLTIHQPIDGVLLAAYPRLT